MTSNESASALIATVQEQEARLQFIHFTNDDAWQLGGLLVDLARESAAPVVIDIRRNGQQLFHYALPGTSADNDSWVERKCAVVNRFGHSSYLVGLRYRLAGRSLDNQPWLDPRLYAAHGGAFPITVVGVGVVGTVAVSGLPQEDDHQMLVDAIERFLS